MSSQFFGFDDDETANVSDINKIPNAPKKVEMKEKTSPDKLSISEIQALLCQDLETSTVDSTIDSTTNETSIYVDEQDLKNFTSDTLTETIDEVEFYQDEPTIDEKPEKKPRKVLGDIENKTLVKPSKTYKKPAQPTVSKKVEKKPAKKRKARKNDENEVYDKFAEQINKQFAQVENFKLLVE